ncbi:MAG: hypothetical protein HY692_06385, partial [Cyanobacteria bacterium NC_groundwater_1444_Ag_S-0.65um_54_12]|nr:hypothetical protein [Cyanobacteria bacterium NC_groundwater_1444_Ag_S-0.65um_54_12]
EAYRAYQDAKQTLEEIVQLPPALAWERLGTLAIERVKGKAYAICVFYENFKNDTVLDRLFPPPPGQTSQQTDLSFRSAPTRPLSTRPSAALTEEPKMGGQPATGEKPWPGLLGKLRGIFNK